MYCKPSLSRTVSFGIACLLLGCGGGESTAHRPENAARQSEVHEESEANGSRTPLLRIESQDTVDLGDVAGVAVLPSGRIAIASYRPAAVRLFSEEGVYLHAIGRRGGGPGEFRTLDNLALVSDTLLVTDLEETVHFFTPDGRFVRAESRPQRGGRLHGFLAGNARVLGVLETSGLPVGKRVQALESLWRHSGVRRDSLGVFPSQEVIVTEEGRLEGDLFSPHNRVAVFVDGFCAGYSGGRVIRCFDANGVLDGTVELSGWRSIPVTAADRETFFNDFYVANRGTPKALIDEEVERLRARRTFSSVLGVFGRLVPGRDGLLWIGPPSTDAYRFSNPNAVPDSASRWEGYTRDGNLIASVVMPPRFLPLEFGADFVAGVTRDANEEVVVVVYALGTLLSK